MVKSLGKAAQSVTRWIEKTPRSTEMEQQELGKVTHNSKTIEHFNHSLVVCCSEPYFTLWFLPAQKGCKSLFKYYFIPTYTAINYHCKVWGSSLSSSSFAAVTNLWVSENATLQNYFQLNCTLHRSWHLQRNRKKDLSYIINMISETVQIFLL